jgi:hypothetical protein
VAYPWTTHALIDDTTGFVLDHVPKLNRKVTIRGPPPVLFVWRVELVSGLFDIFLPSIFTATTAAVYGRGGGHVDEWLLKEVRRKEGGVDAILYSTRGSSPFVV